VGLRNPAHSLVKLMSPCQGKAFIVGSYTHPEYASSMAATFALTGTHAMLLRGTEGEPVADARRTPQIEAFREGERHLLQAAQGGTLATVPDLPREVDAHTTAAYIRAVLDGERAVPLPITLQLEHILRELHHHEATDHAIAL
jgi:anthranilate phosphoribosyltransferase